MKHTPSNSFGRFSTGMEVTPDLDDNARIGSFADGMTVAEDRLRMLGHQAEAVAELDEVQRQAAGPVLEDAIRATYEYGATEEQIANASMMEPDEVHRILTPAPERLE